MNMFNDDVQTSRIPYFYFEEREVGEDVEQSRQVGYAVPKRVTLIRVTPHGHKGDPFEFFAEEFIERKEREARNGIYSSDWVSQFKAGLAKYKTDGMELPRTGTPLATWGRLLESRRKALAKIFPTVEDLAAVPDSGLNEIGLDGRVLRDLARGDVQSKKDLAPVVRELADANETIRRQEELINSLSSRLEALEADSKSSRKKQ